MSMKRVRAKERGFLFDRIVEPGEEIEVPAKMTAKWWEELDGPKRGRPAKTEESPAVE
jgi:hypothetical protein